MASSKSLRGEIKNIKAFKKVATHTCLALALVSIISLTACNTTTKLIKHGKLDVQTKMSGTVFLDPIADDKKTVLLQIRNTTDRPLLIIESKLRTAIRDKGYKIVSNPKDANLMIQVNILQVGKSTVENTFEALSAGYGSSLEGLGSGVILGGALGSSGRDMLGMGLVAGIGSTILDSAVEVVNFTMTTDLQISEKANGNYIDESSDASLKQGTSGYKKNTWKSKTNWKKYQTRVMSVAKKTNLKFEDAAPGLVSGLVISIAGVL